LKKQGRPPKTDWEECKIEECHKTTKNGAKGFCRTHYMAARRGLIDWGAGQELRPKKRVASYGPGARCLVPNCGRRPKGRGLCIRHYQQWESGTDLGVKVPERGHTKKTSSYSGAVCLVKGCDKRPVNKWMCNKHTLQRESGILDDKGDQLRELKTRGRRPLDWRKEVAGYILVRAPKDHPKARQDGSIYEHRLVMEKHLGRLLDRGEVVHHINGVRDDNCIENLQLRRSRKEHGHGHEMSDDTESAMLVLERLVNCGMTDHVNLKKRLQRLAHRL